MTTRGKLPIIAAIAVPALALLFCAVLYLETPSEDGPRLSAQTDAKQLDPAAWGSDHVGKPLPEFVSGDECLFCHRMRVGPSWSKNAHQLTIRPALPESKAITALKESPGVQKFADEVDFLLGTKQATRFLKRTGQYGKLSLLTTVFTPQEDNREGQLSHVQNPHWDDQLFADSCAGCHATAVDSKSRAFSAVSLDCFTCHGDVPLEHSKDASKAILSSKRNDDPRVVVSICGQCHLRGGVSRSTGRPYAHHFVAGDNLFRDFQVDFSDEQLEKLNPADRHVWQNVRDVVVHGNGGTTCLTCHDVHAQSTAKHQALTETDLCTNCHQPGDPSQLKSYEVHSRTCRY